MTARGRYSGKPRQPAADVVDVRLVGTSKQVQEAIGRLTHVLTIVSQSRELPRREEQGRVAVHVEVRTDG